MHRHLVLSKRAGDVRYRNPPFVLDLRIECHAILGIWQHLTPRIDAEAPWTELGRQRPFEIRAEPGHPLAASPTRASRTTLKAIATYEVGVLRLHVPESSDVDPIRSIAVRRPIERARHLSMRASEERMVHEIPADLIAVVCHPVRESIRLRIQQQARRLDRRCAEKDHASLEF